MARLAFRSCVSAALLLVAVAGVVMGQDFSDSASYSLYGTPGLIDMPSAEVAPDAEFVTTLSYYPGDVRGTLTFQVLPWLSASYRYAGIDADATTQPARAAGLTYDRSFDLRLNVLREGTLRPSVAVGLQDFAGTGLISGEYIVASKSITRAVRLTGGLGWGRLGSDNSIGSFGTRDEDTDGEGGIPTTGAWFRGDFAPFGGVAIRTSPRTQLKFEYSSDAYTDAVDGGVYDRRSPINAAFEYRRDDGTQISLFAIHGSEIGARLSFVFNPKRPSLPGGREEAPLPVLVRPEGAAADTSWAVTPSPGLTEALREALRRDRLFVEGLELTETRATLRLRNARYGSTAQMVGRAARAMARTLPASIEVFQIIPVVDGLSVSSITVRRSDLEDLEFAPAERIQPLVAVNDGFGQPEPVLPTRYPNLSWAIEPYVQGGYFDPDVPVRVDVGLRARAAYRPTSKTKFQAVATQRLFGNLADTDVDRTGPLPIVRTEFPLYIEEGQPGIEQLTFATFGRPGPDLFSRFTVGYLEDMFAGLSGELLWKPTSSRFGLGLEMNRVRQRDFDRRLGFRDYEVTTGHLSGYYQFEQGFYGQVDVGQYLAGDRGATFAAFRTFDNGWAVGAFATFTNVTPEEFGEGSFDKGVVLSIPTSWVLGTPERSAITANLRPLQRNGGARLAVADRLYPSAFGYDRAGLDSSFGRFWR